MKKYYLNLNAQSNGDHEVHDEYCIYLPVSNRDYLGTFYNCKEAVTEAKRRYPYKKIDGCWKCSKDCHKS